MHSTAATRPALSMASGLKYLIAMDGPITSGTTASSGGAAFRSPQWQPQAHGRRSSHNRIGQLRRQSHYCAGKRQPLSQTVQAKSDPSGIQLLPLELCPSLNCLLRVGSGNRKISPNNVISPSKKQFSHLGVMCLISTHADVLCAKPMKVFSDLSPISGCVKSTKYLRNVAFVLIACLRDASHSNWVPYVEKDLIDPAQKLLFLWRKTH